MTSVGHCVREALAIGRALAISTASAAASDDPLAYLKIDAAKAPFDAALHALDDMQALAEALDRLASDLNDATPFPEAVWLTKARSVIRDTGRICVEPVESTADSEESPSGY